MFTQGLQTSGIGAAPLVISGFSWVISGNTATITISGSEGATWNYSDLNISGPPSSGTIGAGGTSVLTGSFSRPTCSNQSITLSASISASGETIIEEGVPTTLSTSVSGTTGTVTLYVDGTAVVTGSLSSNTGTVNVNFTGNNSAITRVLVYITAGGGSGVQVNGGSSAFLYVNSSSGSVNANLTATGSAANRFQLFMYMRPVDWTLPCVSSLVQYPRTTYNLS